MDIWNLEILIIDKMKDYKFLIDLGVKVNIDNFFIE